MIQAAFEFRPGLRLLVTGDAATVRHFEREYAVAEVPNTRPTQTEARFVRSLAGPATDAADSLVLRGGHKSVGWDAVFSKPTARPLVVTLRLRGRPRSFARSLVQGYFVEPLLSLAAPAAGSVLVPGAAIGANGSLALLLGRSRTGKSSVSVRALGQGNPVLGDDQLFVDAHGVCRTFPRRLRLYTDLSTTASKAYQRAPSPVKLRLAGLKVLKILTHGYVAPSLAVDARAFGSGGSPIPLPVGRIVLLERSSATERFELRDATTEEAVRHTQDALAEQRSHLPFASTAGEPSPLRALHEDERAILHSAFGRAPVQRATIPLRMGAPESIDRVAALVGLEP